MSCVLSSKYKACLAEIFIARFVGQCFCKSFFVVMFCFTAGKECRVCDVMFNPDVYAKATKVRLLYTVLFAIKFDFAASKC